VGTVLAILLVLSSFLAGYHVWRGGRLQLRLEEALRGSRAGERALDAMDAKEQRLRETERKLAEAHSDDVAGLLNLLPGKAPGRGVAAKEPTRLP
jgi:hypothetical protein